MKLSILIPYYNKDKYIGELLDCLVPQLNKDVEVIIVDDGSDKPLNVSYEHVTVIRKDNGGVSSARNVGIDNSTGEYISFIDADDIVSKTFVKDVIDRIPFDYLDMSWKSMPGGNQFEKKLNTSYDKLDNPSVCTRVFNRQFIGKLRFNTNKDGAEDEEFTRKLHLESGKRAVIPDYSYFYRTMTENSATKKYMSGGLNTKRIIYHFNHITSDMQYLINEIKEEDKFNEVIVMTDKNDLPELEEYARIQKPTYIRGMELRGEYTPYFTKIPMPIHTQVVIWTDTTFAIGGIETFIYNFCFNMKKYYDITFLYHKADINQLTRLSKIVQVIRNNTDIPVFCDTVIVNRITDKVPENIQYKKKIQMCHTCKLLESWNVPDDNDYTVFVSETARRSFNKQGPIIHNLTVKGDIDKPLILLSATRLNSFEKGDKRMIEFAKHLKLHNINFLWLIFSETVLKDAVEGMIFLKPTLDIQGYMKIADYVVQLSDSEAFCYTIVEALQLGIPVLTTPLEILSEIGFEDAENGYILPYDMSHIDFGLIKECSLKGFKYKYDNKKIIGQWKKLLGDTVPVHGYSYKPIKVIIKTGYYDVERQENMKTGTECLMLPDRALVLKDKGLVEIL